MIEHIKILSFLLTLIFSIWVLNFIYQKSKLFSYRYLKSLCWYTIVTNLGFLFLLLYAYFDINLLENIISKNHKLFILISDIFISLLGIGLLYFMTQILLNFRSVYIKPKLKKIILILTIIITLSYIFQYISYTKTYFTWLNFLRKYLFENIIILEVIALLLSIAIPYKQKEYKKVFISFSLLYISRYVVTVIIIILYKILNIPESYKLLIGFIALLIYNVVPIIWIKLFFQKFAQSITELIEKNTPIEYILEKYNISKRETEIIKLVLEGKTNTEIKDQLYISFHTVKNHISNIYTKLSIKSRHELMHFFIQQKINK